jgi:predicted ABC-class ATPase
MRRFLGKSLLGSLQPRVRQPAGYRLQRKDHHGKRRIFAKEAHRLNFGKQVIDLTAVEQLMEASQTRGIGQAIEYAKKYMDAKIPHFF